MKTILVANNHLKMIGGTESFTFTLIENLKSKGYDIEYFTFDKGVVSDLIETELGVSFMSKKHYDLILANHNTCVDYLAKMGVIIQTCHGIFPKLEQPNKFADGHVSISKEIQDYLILKNTKSKIILNGINCKRFKPIKKVHQRLTNVLSLSQSTVANDKIEQACIELSVNFTKINKYENPIWDIENTINDADIVIGLGRSAYDAMACGRPVVSYDEREYTESFADGYLTVSLVDKCIENNCSGRYFKKKFTVEDIKKELLKYNHLHGNELRDYALMHFNIDKNANAYLKYGNSLKKTRSKFVLNLRHLKQWFKVTNRSLRHKRKRLFN